MSEPTEIAALLNFEEARVLGCLLEKEVTTPDVYPMSLNGLTNACNQRSNRFPTVAWDEKTVELALESLRRKKLAIMTNMAGSRVPKYKHSIVEVLDRLTPATRAVLCELLVRGRQTLGELRTNTERLFSFPDLARMEEAVQALVDYPTGPLAEILPPGNGRKAKTVVHLLCGPAEADATLFAAPANETIVPPPPDWKQAMEEKIAALESRIVELEAIMAELEG